MCVLYPAYLKRSASVASSSGTAHGIKFVSSSNCIPVRNESRPVISDAFFCSRSRRKMTEGEAKQGRGGRRSRFEVEGKGSGFAAKSLCGNSTRFFVGIGLEAPFLQ